MNIARLGELEKKISNFYKSLTKLYSGMKYTLLPSLSTVDLVETVWNQTSVMMTVVEEDNERNEFCCIKN